MQTTTQKHPPVVVLDMRTRTGVQQRVKVPRTDIITALAMFAHAHRETVSTLRFNLRAPYRRRAVAEVTS